MKKIIEKLMEVMVVILLFFKKKNVKEIRKFSELITEQYEFLVIQLEKVLKDYFGLSDRIKEMHTEIFSLRKELMEASSWRCLTQDCMERK